MRRRGAAVCRAAVETSRAALTRARIRERGADVGRLFILHTHYLGVLIVSFFLFMSHLSH